MDRISTVIPEDRIELHGMDLSYRYVQGPKDAPVIVLVHGMVGSSAMWLDVMKLLRGHVTVVAPDMLGHGKSSANRSLDYSLGNQASTIRDLLSALKIERATFVGQSLGGGVVMQLSYQFPELVERMVLVDAGGLGKEVSPLLRALSLPGSGPVLAAVTWKPIIDVLNWVGRVGYSVGLRLGPEEIQMMQSFMALADPASRRAFLMTLRSVVDPSGQSVAARNRLYLSQHIPVMVMWGTRDFIIPFSHAEQIEEVMPHRRLEVYEGAGHYPNNSFPERFADDLIDFVSTTDPAEIDTKKLKDILAQ